MICKKHISKAIGTVLVGILTTVSSFATHGNGPQLGIRPAVDYTQRNLVHGDVVKVRAVLNDLLVGDMVMTLEVDAISMQPQAEIRFFVDGKPTSRLNFNSLNVQQKFILEIKKRNGIDYKSLQLQSIGNTVITKIVANIYDPNYVNPDEPVLPLPPPPPPVNPGPGPSPFGNCRTVSNDRVFGGLTEADAFNECRVGGGTNSDECYANTVCQQPKMTWHTDSSTSNGTLVKIHGYDAESTRLKCHKHPQTRNAECDKNLNREGQPVYPPNPPPVIVNPPQPPPPPPQLSDVRGRIYRMDDEGVISGYACDRHSSRNVQVTLEIGGRLIGAQMADQYLNSSEMGSPSFDGCGSATGFKFVINPEMYAGNSVRAQLFAISPVNNARLGVDDELHTYPLLRVDVGVFTVGNAHYYSHGISRGTYCQFSTMDQVRIYQQYQGGKRDLTSTPKLMENRGVCEDKRIKEGFFSKMSGPEIYFSNGKDAFCHVPTMEMVGGNPHPRLVDNLPSPDLMRNDGVCQYNK